MSVNFYARTPLTSAEEGLHIGQAADHHPFLMRAHPQQGLTTVHAWVTYLSRPEISIVAESGYLL